MKFFEYEINNTHLSKLNKGFEITGFIQRLNLKFSVIS
jgi:hypothetical protein